MDKLRVKIWRLERIIATLVGKCNSCPSATYADGTVCELEARRRMKGKLLEKLAWAEREWEGIDEDELECAEMAVGQTEEKIEYLRRVREVVLLTEDME
jgi:hypothetical protein